ncbi:YdaS family helix-turn-helix protein [Novosphingobium clariflavum]|uniref:YdaS family helix-turn-helix protein n=1 Tax=Novosphingobium clariflavum TaxID=2029884 RepID=A0ABV6S2V8_9SPHN|nr:YdaS family helix-turn-helix protein [Novosphingobium clariflavum]
MTDAPSPYEALLQTVKIAGSQSALARICSVGQPAVWKWLQSSKRLPAEYVLRVETATGVSRHHLRPDIYPLDMPPAPRWTGIDQRPSVRTCGVDRRTKRVSFKNNDISKGARA